ncbi:MAG TPA: ComEC/Rec2 family competence protein [Candidatus Nanoarchaeia archaeon]|nr:ComEC/Rec2 family competence protein [Candidatus Nanoarchaeia archaeon]
MKRRVVIFIACWFFAGGIVIASFLPKELMFFDLYYFTASVIFLILSAWFWRKKNVPHHRAPFDGAQGGRGRRAILLWAAFLFFGTWRFAVSLPVNSPDKIFYYNGNKTEFIGVVSAEPTTKGKSQKLEVKSLELEELAPRSSVARERPSEVGGKVLVITSLYPQYNYGDILRITCKLERPQPFADFDYEKYLAAQGIYSTCSFPKIEILSDKFLSPPVLAEKKKLTRFNWLWGGIFFVREKLSATIDNGLTEPEAGLLKAFLLNDPTVPDDLNLSFRQSGLAHIVAISGSHISELIGIVFFCLLFFGLNRRHAFWFCVPVIIFYVAMVGSPASAVRAGIMGFLVLLAMYLGRLARLDYTLALAGAGMLLFNPMLVIADAGFQLSFLAVLGMIYLYPVFDKWLAQLRPAPREGLGFAGQAGLATKENKIIKIIRQTFALTLAAQVFTAPILIFGFHQISLVAPLANLFALWSAPFIMITAFIAMALTLIFPAGAIYFFLPADILVKYLIAVAQISASLPFSYWKF